MSGEFLVIFLIFGPFVAAALEGCLGEERVRTRNGFAALFLAAEFALAVLALTENAGRLAAGDGIRVGVRGICGFGLTFQMDGFRTLYALIAAFMWLTAGILSVEYFQGHRNQKRFTVFFLMTLGAVMGIFLSQDLLTTYVFFEIMSLTSYTWVAQEESFEALRAAQTYLAVAVIGGMVMLMGLFLLCHELGTLDFDGMMREVNAGKNSTLLFSGGVCILVGFGAKAGAFPLHIWLPKAHPVAPAPASSLLSGILTKTGIFGILVLTTRLFSGNEAWGLLILALGVLTMLGGAILAIFSVDLKRVLACSSMSQIGFILVGVGMMGLLGTEGEMAARGTFLHMVNHSLIKLVLFLAAGVIYQNTHALDLNRIRGFGRKKILLMGIFLVGALAISGIPFFGGYISKTLLHESILEYGGGGLVRLTEGLFLLSGGLTLSYMTKLFLAVFVEKNADAHLQEEYDRKKSYMNPFSGAALTVSAMVLFLWGLFPHLFMDRAAGLAQRFLGFAGQEHPVSYFARENLKGAVVTLIVGALVYLLVIRLLLRNKKGQYVDRWQPWMDLEDLLYRPILLETLPTMCAILCRVLDSAPDALVVLLRKTLYRDSPLPHEREEGNFLTEWTGRIMNRLYRLKCRIQGIEPEPDRDAVHLCAMKYLELKETGGIITRSLSFGLLLFGLGLCLTLLYILF